MNKLISILGYLILAMLGLAAPSAVATCKNDITASTPDQDFSLHSDGTVTHHRTSLIWMRCSLGQIWDGSTCTSNASTYKWENALLVAQNEVFAGQSDWRLPNKNELASLVEQRCANPAINRMVFPNTSAAGFWSSSPGAFTSDGAWGVVFSDGGVFDFSKGNIRNNFQVRLVRAGR
jgi:hypothetical protein